MGDSSPPLLLPGNARLQERLTRLAAGQFSGADELLPWAAALPPVERERFCRDLALLFQEPELTGEPLDWRELFDVLHEYADAAGWDGPVVKVGPEDGEPAEGSYRIDLRPQDARLLESASPAVRRATQEVLTEFLTIAPTDSARLRRGDLKKLQNRDIWQIDLPDGYRLRYYVDEPERVVYVVYLGPHPDGAVEGRERAVRALVQRRRHAGGL